MRLTPEQIHDIIISQRNAPRIRWGGFFMIREDREHIERKSERKTGAAGSYPVDHGSAQIWACGRGFSQ